jgi:hypothetical protein
MLTRCSRAWPRSHAHVCRQLQAAPPGVLTPTQHTRAGEDNYVAALATTCAVLHQAFDYFHWTVSSRGGGAARCGERRTPGTSDTACSERHTMTPTHNDAGTQ